MGRKRKNYSPEFKADAVRLVHGGRSAASVARDLGIAHSALGRWVQQGGIDAGRGPEGALTSTERQELSELRREIIEKTAAFFAKENG